MSASAVVTIERHILDQQKQYPNATGELTSLLYDMALCAKLIARETTRAGLVDMLGDADSENSYGERQQKLDLYADSTIFRMNDHTGRLCAMASEEHEEIRQIPRRYGTGRYVLLYDPLDGSSNIDVNVSVGTIFAVHRKVTTGTTGALADVLQPGNRLVAAGYVIYGSSTMMVYTTGQGVHGFTLDPGLGEFLLSHPDLRIPPIPKFFSANLSGLRRWTPGVQRFTRWLLGDDAGIPAPPPLSQRYIGSMVSDVHRNLLQGGIFYYPGDLRDPAKPYGKLRLLFEAQALGFIVANAGGRASDGLGSVLDIQPHRLHQRCPMFIGNADLVAQAEAFIAEHDADWIAAYRAYRNQVPEGL